MSNDGMSDTSTWNMAPSTFERLNITLLYINASKQTNNYAQWYKHLKILHDELWSHIPEDKRKKCESHYKDLRPLMGGNYRLDANMLDDRLSDWEHILRDVLKERRIDLPRGKDPNSAMLN